MSGPICETCGGAWSEMGHQCAGQETEARSNVTTRTVEFRCRCGRPVIWTTPAWQPSCSECREVCDGCLCPQAPPPLADAKSEPVAAEAAESAVRPDLDAIRARYAPVPLYDGRVSRPLDEDVIDLCDYAASLEEELAAARDGLRAIEWLDETDTHQCAWCLAPKNDGHEDGCALAGLLATLARGGGE